ncbi:caspase family protein [Qingshengfaniella alkalisoli]|uniref:Peptidase C14, caspase catalytic subunit p20 n=1 Tax=Qingshengfaniella alkalisoli TaxID=2599296 RepID=A0A5B8I9H9_9RHOB|nr:caspase family protein [Qingshengfaniella alkalisoli]QDY70935.1 peptidase C14, caspase catalytic subunit p20 [Qingshengfaniella alkalisoli]
MKLQLRFKRLTLACPAPSGFDATLRIFLIACVLALISSVSVQAETRLALVIGNGNYATVEPLENPVNDAADVAAALEGLDFEVLRGIDATAEQMNALIAEFAERSQTTDVSLFFYAGHGFQAASQNYLLPVDAVIQSADDVAAQTIQLNQITDALAKGDGQNLIFLDACRNNPLGDALAGTVESGLARIGDAAGFLFAFATQPDNVAYDGAGRNSPFTQALLGHIATPAQDVSSMMISVRKDVLAATGGKQVPWENSSLTRSFQFVPGDTVTSPETMLWQVAAKAQDPALMRIYLDRYPEGAHVSDVYAFLDEFQVAGLSADQNSAIRNLPARGNADVLEESLWDLARRTRSRPLIEVYLQQNPNGRFAQQAQVMLQSLPITETADAAPELRCEKLATHPRDATANTAGVPLAELARNATVAIESCRQAAADHPEQPHYTALLARALAAGGQRGEALTFYEQAASQGDLRAMVSLGLIKETGDGVPKDVPAAISLYERAAQGGSPDGAINLAVALFQGSGINQDIPRAIDLLKQASDAGSAIATYNLGVLTQDGVTGQPAEALDYFRRAVDLGEPRGYVAAAILLDEGRGVEADATAAAEMLLRGVAADSGQALAQLTDHAVNWSPDTLRAIQSRLQEAGLYDGAIDGVSGPMLQAGLQQWRNGGFIAASSAG